MQDTLLDKIHRTEMDIMREIDRICRKHNLTYFLSCGTLLGVVRHKGFIPWDDDMDIDMTRENYDKFIAACKTGLNPEFRLQTWITDPNYHNGFAKILLKGTCAIEKRGETTLCEKGVFVDIFPWDNIYMHNRRCIIFCILTDQRILYNRFPKISFCIPLTHPFVNCIM